MMLAEFEKNVVPVYNESETDKSLDEIVTLASMVEREAANDEERGKVASVFVNRLNIGMKLESCAPYNTYKYEGLPVGPIASPGLRSIQAALNPDDTNYYYFLAVADGSQNLFSETFEEHNQKLQEEQGTNSTEESGDV